MVAISVTGHRNIVHLDPVISGVDEVLCKISNMFPGEKLTIISPLAEGADRLVVWRAMEKLDVQLIVPLPLEMSDYMQDFDSLSSKAEFVTLLEHADKILELPVEKTREASYQVAGLYILDNSDILIAIWDGQPGHGTGGTGQIVSKAREKLMPIAWVFAGGQARGSQAILAKKPGELTYENFPITPHTPNNVSH